MKKGINWRKALFRLHGWLGLNVGLLLFVICFSGSIATLSHEIDWLLNPSMRAPAREQSYDWTAMHEALSEAFPDGRTLGVYAPEEPGFAALAYVAVPDGQRRKVYLNPYTGAVQGHTSFFNTQRFFRSFHRRFFDGERGIVIITLCAFVLLVAAASGLLYYKGWLKQLLTLRRDKGTRIFWSDVHKGIGIWGLAFALLIALTGIFYFVEVCFQAAGEYDELLPPPLPEVEEASLEGYGPQPELLPAGAYVEAARAAFPGLKVKSVRLPHHPGEAVYIDGQAGNPITRDRANKVLLHPFSGEVIAIQRSSHLGVVPFITDAVDPLHFGYFGGLWTKVLWCLFGLMLSFAILAGTYLWVVRSRPVRRTRTRRAAPGDPPLRLRPFVWLRGAPVAFALTVAYFVVAVFATVGGIRAYGARQAPAVPIDTATIGPYRVQLACAPPCRIGEGAVFTVRFQGEGLPNYRSAALSADTARAVLAGPARAPGATLTAARGEPIRLRVTLRSGETHAAVFSISALEVARASAGAASASSGPSWPDTAPGVWWVVGAFTALTVGIIIGWLYCLIRAFKAVQQKTLRRRRRTSAPASKSPAPVPVALEAVKPEDVR